MTGIKVVYWGLLLVVISGVLPVRAQEKPLSREDVLGLVRNQLGDQAGARAVEKRGIDFEPDADFLRALHNAGATDVFITALRQAGHSRPPAPAPPAHPEKPSDPPLDVFAVFDLLINQVNHQRIEALIRARGVTINSNRDTLATLQSLGATPEILRAVRACREGTVDTGSPVVKKHAAYVEQDYRARLRRDPGNWAVRYALGYALAAQSKNAEEVALDREWVRLEPKRALAHKALAEALIADSEGSTPSPEIIPELRKAIQLDPHDPEPHLELPLELNDPDQIKAEFQQAILADPDCMWGYDALFGWYAGAEDWKGAVAEFRADVERTPQSAWAHEYLALALQRDQDRKAALAEFGAAVRLNPNEDDIHESYGTALLEDHDLDAAAVEFREAVRLIPGNASAHRDLASVLLAKGDKQAALTELKKAYPAYTDDQIQQMSEGLEKESSR